MPARRIAPSLLPLCALLALTACAGTPASSPAPAPGPGAATEAPGGATSPGTGSGETPQAGADTRRLSGNELEGSWALRSATDAAGARIDALFPEVPAEVAAAQPGGKLEATLEFDTEGRVSAYAGCNRIAGSYKVVRDRLTLSLTMMTKRGCPDPLNRVDAELSERLSAGFRAVIFEGMPLQLRLTAEDGSVYRLERVPTALE